MAVEMSKHQEHPLNYGKLNSPRASAVRGLNNLYVLANLTSKALFEMQRRAARGEEDELEFEAPSANNETTTVTRDRTQLDSLLVQARKRGIYEQSLVTAVGVTEDYLQRTLRLVLRWYPGKLRLNIDGSQTNKNVPMELILGAGSLSEVVDALIQRQLISTFYGSPERYFQYIENILSIKLDKELKAGFSEIKATRDIIIHNSGKANEIYVEKAGQKARGQAGEDLEVDADYFKHSIGTMKKMIQQIFRRCLGKYSESQQGG